MPIEYLSFTEVAGRLGVKTGALATYKLPQPDAHHRTHAAAGSPRPSTNGTRNAPAAVSAEDDHARKLNKNEKAPQQC